VACDKKIYIPRHGATYLQEQDTTVFFLPFSGNMTWSMLQNEHSKDFSHRAFLHILKKKGNTNISRIILIYYYSTETITRAKRSSLLQKIHWSIPKIIILEKRFCRFQKVVTKAIGFEWENHKVSLNKYIHTHIHIHPRSVTMYVSVCSLIEKVFFSLYKLLFLPLNGIYRSVHLILLGMRAFYWAGTKGTFHSLFPALLLLL
jgi:hypothetical protein